MPTEASLEAIAINLDHSVRGQEEIKATLKELSNEQREGFSTVDLRLDRLGERMTKAETHRENMADRLTAVEKTLEKKADAKLLWWVMGLIGAGGSAVFAVLLGVFKGG